MTEEPQQDKRNAYSTLLVPVGPNPLYQPDAPKGLVDLIKAFHPYGDLFEALRVWLAFRWESKWLDKQAGLCRQIIDDNHEQNMEELSQRWAAIRSLFDSTKQRLGEIQVGEKWVFEVSRAYHTAALDPSFSLEERKHYSQRGQEILAMRDQLSHEATENLKILFGSILIERRLELTPNGS